MNVNPAAINPDRNRTSVLPVKEELTKETLIAAARALDEGNSDEARHRLRSLPLALSADPTRLIAFALWKRLLTSTRNAGSPKDEPACAVLTALDKIGAAATHRDFFWDAYEAIPILEARVGATDAAAFVASTIWDCVLKSNPHMFIRVFELFYLGERQRCVLAMEQFLTKQRNYSPGYFDFVLLMRSINGRSHQEFAALLVKLLRNTQREDLAPLFQIYLMQMRQTTVSKIVAAARALTDAAQRLLVAQYMTQMGYMPEELPVVVASFTELVGNSESDKPAVDFMQARLAIAECRWHDAIELAGRVRADREFFYHAILLRALASARLKKLDDADALLEKVHASADASTFDHTTATFIQVTTELVRSALPLPEERPLELMPSIAGRPLVQSLWVGRKLRWIERLSIKSYLDNGWRFQLYVYDDPDNVPEGCEVLDAAAILPAKDVFAEGQRSGVHAGSIGAFSDLFRYQLLCKRGGLWTDLDVINFRMYDADGKRFVSAEVRDAGIITLNGAIMAAPAGDELVTRAYARARFLLSSDEAMFFTRIGPVLLAEVTLELGVGAVEIMPPSFLSPISCSWMNTAFLLQPFEVLMARPEFQQAVNVHVFAEMWRTLGLGLDQPPSKETFLGRLYADHFGE
jgi:hypothetical protein